jgi:hypothetical protein
MLYLTTWVMEVNVDVKRRDSIRASLDSLLAGPVALL